MSNELEDVPGLTTSQSAEIVNSVRTSAGQSIVKMEENPALSTVVADSKDAYTESARITALVAAIFVFFGLLVSFGLPKDSTEDDTAAADDDVPVGA